MSFVYKKDGVILHNDFEHTIDGVTYQIPYENLFVWSDEEMAVYGVTKEVDNSSVPMSISDRQFYQQLAINNFITKDEALAAVMTGTLPAALEAFVNALPDDNSKFAAKMLLSGAVEFRRDHPLTIAVGQANGLTNEQIDTFFHEASLL